MAVFGAGSNMLRTAYAPCAVFMGLLWFLDACWNFIRYAFLFHLELEAFAGHHIRASFAFLEDGKA